MIFPYDEIVKRQLIVVLICLAQAYLVLCEGERRFGVELDFNLQQGGTEDAVKNISIATDTTTTTGAPARRKNSESETEEVKIKKNRGKSSSESKIVDDDDDSDDNNRHSTVGLAGASASREKSPVFDRKDGSSETEGNKRRKRSLQNRPELYKKSQRKYFKYVKLGKDMKAEPVGIYA